jgi:tight adherence protein B
MTILFFFVLLFALIFGVMMLLLRPPATESALEVRLRAVLAMPQEQTAKDPLAQEIGPRVPGTFDWLEDLLQGTTLLQGTQLLLLQAQSSARIGNVIVFSAALGFGVSLAVYAATSNVVLAAPCLLLAAGPYAWLRHKRTRRVNAFDAVLPAAIELCARSLRAGHSIAAAIGAMAEEAAEPARTEFGEVFRKQNYGLPQREALMEMLDRVPSRDLRVFVTGILVQKDTGGNLPEIMDRIVAVIRDRFRIQGEVRTHTAQGRLTGWILCLLPLALMLLINLMNPGYSRVLLQDPVGQKLLYGGVILLASGALMIRSIVRGIEV